MQKEFRISNGQSLIEVVISVGIATILALLATGNKSVKTD